MRRLLTVTLILFTYAGAYPQSVDPIFRHVTRSNGLPVDEVTCIAQDNKGFMWLGTKEGLYKYDGFSFKGFFNKPGDRSTIPGNDILRIYADPGGFLWILTSRAGLALMTSEGKVIQVINSTTNPSFPGLDYVYNLKRYKEGFYWCTTDDGLFNLQNDNGNVKIVQRFDLTRYQHSTNNLGPFTLDKTGKLWICTLNGLVIYDPLKDILYHKGNNPFHLPVFNETAAFAQIHLDEEGGKLWYSTWEPATRVYDLKLKINKTIYSGKELAIPDYGQIARTIFTDSHQNTWMATSGGAAIFMENTKKNFAHQDDNASSIVSSRLNDVVEDREGNIWFATDGGISITRPYDLVFVNLSGKTAKEYAFAGDKVVFITPADSNSLLIGSNGLFETDNNFKVRQHFITGTMNYDWVWNYFQDEKNKQIFISTQGGMLVYNIESHTIKKLLTPPFNERLPVSSFVSADNGNVWMSRYRDVFFKYNLKDKTFRKYNITDLGEKPQILSLFRDNEHRLWLIGQRTGLLRFDEKTGTIVERIGISPVAGEGLLQSSILCVKDVGKTLFIGYVNKGFSLYNKLTKKFDHYSRADGLAGNSVTDAFLKNEIIWIATGNGISRFDTAAKEFINYNYDNGILDNNFESVTQLPDGRIAAGSATGMVLFHPDSINTIKDLPPPIISDLVVYGKQISADSIIGNHQPLHISYKENYFSIEYISLLYQHNQQIEYAYLLEGLDKNWIPSGDRRFVSYSNLKGGDYHFKVKARLPGGKWVESVFSLPVIVHAAFYTQWWFYLLLAVFFMLIVYGLYRYRLQQFVRMESMRTAISSDLHDEVGAALSSISIFSEMAKMSVEKSSKAETYLLRIGERSRESIEKMSDIIWSINPENDSFGQVLFRMKNYANEILEARNIAVHWAESENLSLLKLSMPQRKNLYLLFKEVINNAAKYSCATNCYIKVDHDYKCIKLSVTDDGIGFNKDKVKAGNGIKNIYRRAELLKGKLSIDSINTGTSVQLVFAI